MLRYMATSFPWCHSTWTIKWWCGTYLLLLIHSASCYHTFVPSSKAFNVCLSLFVSVSRPLPLSFSVFLSICVTSCLSVYITACLPVCLYVGLSVCLPVYLCSCLYIQSLFHLHPLPAPPLVAFCWKSKQWTSLKSALYNSDRQAHPDPEDINACLPPISWLMCSTFSIEENTPCLPSQLCIYIYCI